MGKQDLARILSFRLWVFVAWRHDPLEDEPAVLERERDDTVPADDRLRATRAALQGTGTVKHTCSQGEGVVLGPVYTKRQRQLCNDASNSVPIENNGVTWKWVVTLSWSGSIVFNENSIARVIAALSQHWWCKRAILTIDCAQGGVGVLVLVNCEAVVFWYFFTLN